MQLKNDAPENGSTKFRKLLPAVILNVQKTAMERKKISFAT